jgi:hypothetical protein
MDEYQRTTIRLTKELHLASRIKALRTGVSLTEAITRFLEEWVAGRLELPEPEEEEDKE